MRIEELHEKLYDLLLLIDDVCKENSLRYFVAYGTAIGSVREKDFIPWDDDMDIMVLAEDYDRFKEIMKKKLPAYLHFIEPQDFKPYFYDYTIRIIDERWFLRKETELDKAYRNYENHVGVDVFVAAGCPASRLGKRLFMIKNKILYGMTIQFRYQQDYSKYSLLQKVQVSLLRTMGILYSHGNPQRIIKRWFGLLHMYDAKRTGWRFVLNAPLTAHYQKALPDEWFQRIEYGRIRDKKVPIPGGYDRILHTVYGDYMQPEKDTEKYFTHLDKEDRQ